jgi:signal transduction histidine kinase/CheY-like chemotaxis protein
LQIIAWSSAIAIVSLALISLTRSQRQLGLVTSARDNLARSSKRLVEAAHQREKLAEQLRQSQKMDALGQLTGGLAHDFNNMLAVIMSSLSIAKRRMARGEPDISRYLESAIDGAVRAATLTTRLLAFSRQQPLMPELIDPNKFVAGMAELLRASLGETVHLETALGGGLWRIHVDTSQLENVVLNLAINAHDAMPDGGNLTIETSNSHLDDEYAKAHADVMPGQYVMITVTDTGVGMSHDLIKRAFDPFFTTKPVGKGTGLGLSQVYGFIKQSGGHVSVYSEPGRGTAFRVYIPRYYQDDEVQKPSPVVVTNVSNSHSKDIILVVEDDERIREITVEALRELRYTVLHADCAAAALLQLDNNPDVALLFTDIVMPGMNGRELAAEALIRRPGLKVLYTSGYMPNAVLHNATLSPLQDLISKPFTIEQLADKVRNVLSRSTMTVAAHL